MRRHLMLRALAATLIAASALGAEAVASEEVHLGVVVSALGVNITIADEEGKAQQTFTVSSETVITLNGMPAKLEELTHGDLVKITTDTRDGKTTVKSIDAKSAKTKLAAV